jgi:hypothetical protein
VNWKEKTIINQLLRHIQHTNVYEIIKFFFSFFLGTSVKRPFGCSAILLGLVASVCVFGSKRLIMFTGPVSTSTVTEWASVL